MTGGNGNGINAFNSSGGALSIAATDTVFSTSGAGIGAENTSDGTDLTISAAGVSGGETGIFAVNSGSGDLIITTTGQVTGGTGNGIDSRNFYGGELSITAADTVRSSDATGIYARNFEGSHDLTISAAAVSGGTFGIEAWNQATGDLNISATGAVTGGSEHGIKASNENGGDLTVLAQDAVSSASANGIAVLNKTGTAAVTISTAAVSGDGYGIQAQNRGTGMLSITAGGAVTGTNGDGIAARLNNTDSGADLTISAVDVFGGDNGISASNNGTGSLSITSTGTVTAVNGEGITARISNNASTADLSIVTAHVSGNYSAIDLEHNGKGQFGVTVNGDVTSATGAAINIFNGPYFPGGTITVAKTGSVGSASGLAVYDDNGPITITSSGALAGELRLIGGEDKVQLVDGSAIGLINLGGDDDTLEIFGAGVGGGWDDADFSGTFDNNLGQVLQIDGDGGFDTVELFGVTADSDALGVPVGIDALALSDFTLLQANNADLTPFGALVIDGSSTLQGEGNSPSDTTVGPLGNEGVVDLQDGEANDTLTVDGDYAGGTGSQLWLDLDGDSNASDTFFVLGDVTDVTAGMFTVINDQTIIDINAFGRGGPTLGDGIRLIEVSGAVDEDDFILAGPVELGIFDYQLEFEDGEFFLVSDFFDQIYAYEALPGAMQSIGLALAGQLVERVGVRSAVPSALQDANGAPVEGGGPVDSAIWGRAVGLSLDSEGDLDSTTGGSFEQTIGFVQAGVDLAVLRRQSGRLIVGAMGHWGTSSVDVAGTDDVQRASADFDFYGGGLTATWYATSGLYFDNVLQYTAYDVDISGGDRFGSTSTDGHGITASHELGYRIPIGETAALVPQAQITYQHLDLDDFTDPNGVRVSLDDGDSLVGRLGLAFENSAAIGSSLVTGYVEANLLHEFLGDNQVNVTSLGESFQLTQDLSGTSVEVGFGGTVAVNRGVSLYAEIDYTIPFDNGLQGFQALGGIRVNLNPAPPPPMPEPAVIAVNYDSAFIVFFDWDRADLTPEANLVLDDVVVVANESGYASIRLDGYTDLSGSAAYNLGLSERRANSVADGLIARGIAPDEIVIRAFGEENPLVPTPDGVREPQNRRVEIFLS